MGTDEVVPLEMHGNTQASCHEVQTPAILFKPSMQMILGVCRPKSTQQLSELPKLINTLATVLHQDRSLVPQNCRPMVVILLRVRVSMDHQMGQETPAFNISLGIPKQSWPHQMQLASVKYVYGIEFLFSLLTALLNPFFYDGQGAKLITSPPKACHRLSSCHPFSPPKRPLGPMPPFLPAMVSHPVCVSPPWRFILIIRHTEAFCSVPMTGDGIIACTGCLFTPFPSLTVLQFPTSTSVSKSGRYPHGNHQCYTACVKSRLLIRLGFTRPENY